MQLVGLHAFQPIQQARLLGNQRTKAGLHNHPPNLLPLPALPPRSQPFTQRDVEELCRQKDITSLSPFYLDLQDEVLRIQVNSRGACVLVGSRAYRHACKHAQEDWGPDGLAWAVETARFLGSMPMPRSGPPPRPQALACPHASPHSAPLQALTDKLKGMSSELLFATTRHGDLHLQVHTTGEHAAQQPWLGARTRMAVTWWALRLGYLSCKPAYNRGLPPR